MKTPLLSRRIVTVSAVIAMIVTCILAVRKIIGHLKSEKSREFSFQFTTKDTSAGYLLLAPYVASQPRFSELVILLLDGRIVLKKKINGIVSDFRQWKVDGRIRYSYAVYDPDKDPGDYIHGSTAHVVILDSALNEIKNVRLLPHGAVVPAGITGVDHHDFLMLSDDHFITISSYVKTVSNIPPHLSPASHVRVCAPIVQEVLHDSVIWQWDATRFPEFYAASTKGNRFSDSVSVQDYMHINGIAIDPTDSNLIVSFHNTNQLVKVNRRTGDIIWRLGGLNSDFPLTADQQFLRQHNPSFVDGGRTLLLFDNGDSTHRPLSRILEFRLDQSAKKVTYFKTFSIPEPFADSKGSVQLVGDNYIICGGSANYVLKIKRLTGAKIMEAHYNQTSFRAWYVPDISGIKQ